MRIARADHRVRTDEDGPVLEVDGDAGVHDGGGVDRQVPIADRQHARRGLAQRPGAQHRKVRGEAGIAQRADMPRAREQPKPGEGFGGRTRCARWVAACFQPRERIGRGGVQGDDLTRFVGEPGVERQRVGRGGRQRAAGAEQQDRTGRSLDAVDGESGVTFPGDIREPRGHKERCGRMPRSCTQAFQRGERAGADIEGSAKVRQRREGASAVVKEDGVGGCVRHRAECTVGPVALRIVDTRGILRC